VSLNSPDKEIRLRAHAERMFARAERRLRRAATLVDKWKLRLAEMDRASVVTSNPIYTRSPQNRPTELAEDVIVLPCRSAILQGVV
jgi:hypothetical protein